MKRLTIVLGAGGTGSYFIPNILEQYNKEFLEHKVIIWDGDILEKRNLLRQGFYPSTVDMFKSEGLFKMHSPYYNGLLEYKNSFLNASDELLTIVDEQEIDFEEILLVSCVDNHLARLRLFVGQQLLKETYPQKKIIFADSGNEEWFGQTIISVLDVEDSPVISFKQNDFKVNSDTISKGKVDTVFCYVDDWRNNLTKGDHEISCDLIVESSPQNIATNMMSASVLQFSINKASKQNIVENISFNCKKNLSQKLTRSTSEKVEVFLQELVEYLNSEEIKTIFSDRFIEFNKDSESIYIKQAFDLTKTGVVANPPEEIDFETMLSNITQNKEIPETTMFDIETLLSDTVAIDGNLKETGDTKSTKESDDFIDFKIDFNVEPKESKKTINDFEELDSFIRNLTFSI